MTQIDIEQILGAEEIRALLEQAEQAGKIRASDLAEIAETYELTVLEQDALLRELDQRSIEIVEAPVHSETVVALTRLVSSGPVPPDMLSRTEAAARVFQRLLQATQPGALGRHAFEAAADAYVRAGFAGEEKRHHQGGAIGYISNRRVVNLDGKVNHEAFVALRAHRLGEYV